MGRALLKFCDDLRMGRYRQTAALRVEMPRPQGGLTHEGGHVRSRSAKRHTVGLAGGYLTATRACVRLIPTATRPRGVG